MKKSITLIIMIISIFILTGCNKLTKLYVYTELGFEPFEYVSKGKIVGVDIDIMNMVGEKLGKKVVFENVAFDTIIDSVAQGKLTNIGAAGLSITDERLAKVDFSKVYYKANLYVIYKESNGINSSIKTDGNKGVYWEDLRSNKGIGVQTGTTADLFLSDEMAPGAILEGVSKTDYRSLDVAIKDIGMNIDFVIIDELPAKKLVEGNAGLATLPIYYKGENGGLDQIAYDEYAICVTKGKTELLHAINEVLTELLKVDENGINGIQKLVNKHLGLL